MRIHQDRHVRSSSNALGGAVLRHIGCRSASWTFFVTILHEFDIPSPPVTVAADAMRHILSPSGIGRAIRGDSRNTIFFNLSSLFRYMSLLINNLAC